MKQFTLKGLNRYQIDLNILLKIHDVEALMQKIWNKTKTCSISQGIIFH